MFKKLCLLSFATYCLGVRLPAQTTNGLITGTITDSSEAVILQAQVAATNKDTGASRTAKSDNSGLYIVQQLPPGIYDVSITKAGFATQTRPNVQLQVNQSVTLNFQLTLSSVTETVEVTAAPPPLNTTSATLGHVVSHDATVNLPLNGREFTQLALLAPGAAPIQDAQQTGFAVVQGQGGISPSVNGQRGEQNNFTMDGLLNNQLFMNTWAISPPPDALQEFNVQSHITDAQFAISSGANINVVTRSGTNDFHGALWEFNRNAALAARNFFDHNRLPYNQNQYGVYFGGPVRLPHFNGHDNTWFSGYWEGFRAAQSLTYFGGTLTAAERTGDFSALLGPQVATDGLGRPEAKNQIYDPTTSRPDPNHPGAIIRDAFAGNIIPASRIDPTAPIIIQKFYPLPNLNVPAGVLPNLQFSGSTRVETDAVGIRFDHRFGNNDTWFVRYNRTNANRTTPEALPGYVHDLLNYAKTVASSPWF